MFWILKCLVIQWYFSTYSKESTKTLIFPHLHWGLSTKHPAAARSFETLLPLVLWYARCYSARFSVKSFTTCHAQATQLPHFCSIFALILSDVHSSLRSRWNPLSHAHMSSFICLDIHTHTHTHAHTQISVSWCELSDVMEDDHIVHFPYRHYDQMWSHIVSACCRVSIQAIKCSQTNPSLWTEMVSLKGNEHIRLYSSLVFPQ